MDVCPFFTTSFLLDTNLQGSEGKITGMSREEGRRDRGPRDRTGRGWAKGPSETVPCGLESLRGLMVAGLGPVLGPSSVFLSGRRLRRVGFCPSRPFLDPFHFVPRTLRKGFFLRPKALRRLTRVSV